MNHICLCSLLLPQEKRKNETWPLLLVEILNGFLSGHGIFSWLICSSNLVAVQLPFSHLSDIWHSLDAGLRPNAQMKEISSKGRMIARCRTPVEKPV